MLQTKKRLFCFYRIKEIMLMTSCLWLIDPCILEIDFKNEKSKINNLHSLRDTGDVWQIKLK